MGRAHLFYYYAKKGYSEARRKKKEREREMERGAGKREEKKVENVN